MGSSRKQVRQNVRTILEYTWTDVMQFLLRQLHEAKTADRLTRSYRINSHIGAIALRPADSDRDSLHP